MIGIDLEGLGLSHDETDLGNLHVLEELDGTRVLLCVNMDKRRNTEPGASYLDQTEQNKEHARYPRRREVVAGVAVIHIPLHAGGHRACERSRWCGGTWGAGRRGRRPMSPAHLRPSKEKLNGRQRHIILENM